MPRYICGTCGTQYPESERPPARCAICEDERQYIGWNGQTWTTIEELRERHRHRVEPEERGLFGIGTEPSFGIGQRALLIQTPGGNVLWDCIALLDEPTKRWIDALGGLSAIAISHPHFYTTMVEWAHAFDVPVYLHAADRVWVQRPDPALRFWDGDTQEIGDGLTLLRLGGHFPGGTVLHWPAGAGGRGALLTGDILHVVQDRRWVSFMYSYPNLVPLPAGQVRRMAAAVEAFAFARIYGAWWQRNILANAKDAVRRSAERYIRALEGELPA